MRLFLVPTSLLTAILLASCAGTDGGADSGSVLTLDQKRTLQLSGVFAEAAPNVQMSKEALDRITKNLTDEVRAEAPNAFISSAVPAALDALSMKLIFTDYQGGGSSLKSERRSVGLVRVDADILFVDSKGRIVAQYKVDEHFGSSGDVGLTTDVLNVEASFESAVAALLR
jgi:hypothetical protein